MQPVLNDNADNSTITAASESVVAIAPMMDWTDRHCRYFLRCISPSVRLYTEMLTSAAVVHGDADRLLAYDESEHPVALQLGGSDPAEMAAAARRGASVGYDEININVGCPSDRVQSGAFGACLMARPHIVADCVDAMRNAVDVPVTVKTRIGIDDQDSEAFFREFVSTVAAAGCNRFIVHARIAVLSGLSPKENRSVPPLKYPRVIALKRDFPELNVTINGGLTTTEQCLELLQKVDGVMIGRQAYHHPWFLAELDAALGIRHNKSRRDVVTEMLAYIERELAAGTQLKHITRHMLGLFANQPGARRWRRHLSEHAHRPGMSGDLLLDALAQLPDAA